MAANTVKIGPFKDEAGQWRWRIQRGRNKTATSGESFKNKGNARRAATKFLLSICQTPIEWTEWDESTTNKETET